MQSFTVFPCSDSAVGNLLLLATNCGPLCLQKGLFPQDDAACGMKRDYFRRALHTNLPVRIEVW